MLDNTFSYNGHSSDEFGIKIERRPDLSRSARKFKSASVPGRNGNIYQLENAWEEVTVAYDIFAGGSGDGDAIPSFTDIVEWLNSADDYVELTDTYDPAHYRLAIFVDAIDIESAWYQHGKATVKFRCRPQRYRTNPTAEIVLSGAQWTNPTNHIAKPIITLTGSGQRSMTDVEKPVFNNSFTTYQIMGTYRVQMLANLFWISSTINPQGVVSISSGSSISASVTSQDNDTGTISFFPPNSSWGMGMMIPVRPNTNYTIGFEHTLTPTMKLAYVSGNGGFVTKVNEYAVNTNPYSRTFKTDYDTEYLIIAFFSLHSTTTISKLMLSIGSQEQSFQAYVNQLTDTYRINDVVLNITSQGYASAVIDCEKENFLIDGEEYNTAIRVTDRQGNSIDDYIHVAVGRNTASYTGEISTSELSPTRYWDL